MLTVAVDVCVLISPQSTSKRESRNGEVQSERHYMTAGDGDFQLRRSLKKHQEFGKIVSGFFMADRREVRAVYDLDGDFTLNRDSSRHH
jgi:hypothetical protein